MNVVLISRLLSGNVRQRLAESWLELPAQGVTEAWEGPCLCPSHLRTGNRALGEAGGWGQAPVGRVASEISLGFPPEPLQGARTPPACPAPPQERTLAWSLCNVAHSAHKGETWAEALDSLLWVTQRVNCGAQI